MSKVTAKAVQEARKYALHCYQKFADADKVKSPDASSLFNTYAQAFAAYQQLDVKHFEQQMVKK